MKICVKCNLNFSSFNWKCPFCEYLPENIDGITIHALDFAYKDNGFKSEYFDKLFEIESNNFWFKVRNEIIIWALYKYVSNAYSFLEVGCGTGFVLSCISRAFPNMEINGSEIFLNGLTYAKMRTPKAKFMQMDARHVPFVSEFDVIGAFDVLEHIIDDSRVISELNKSLKTYHTLSLTITV